MPKKVAVASAANGIADLLHDLQRLNFSEYEARTYLALLKANPATAYEISKDAGLPRSNTYGALESLTKKAAVQPVSESPVRYVPVEPSVLLGRVSREVKDVCDRLKAGLRNVATKERSDFVWTVAGSANVDAKIDELIAGARRHIWIKASTDILHAHIRQLKRAAGRGVEILIIVFGTDTVPFEFGPNCRVYLHEGNGVRIGGADNLFTITIDYEVALMASVAGDVIGAYTGSEPIVRMAETLIRHDFYMAEILGYCGDAIEQRFGPHLMELRRRTFSPEQLIELERNLGSLVSNQGAVARRSSDHPTSPEQPESAATRGRRKSSQARTRSRDEAREVHSK